MVSDKKLLQLWRSPNFSGSYRGIKTFQILLKTDLNIDVSEDRLYKLLKTDPIFLIHQKPQRKFERRSYDLQNYGELVQADIAYMFEYDSYKYFLLVIDCFSSKLFAVPLKSRDSATVATAFEKVFQEFKSEIYEIQTDRGKEFMGPCKILFKKKHIFYRAKLGKNKANFAENGILMVKKKLYKLLRGVLSQNWVKFLPLVIDSLNNTPMKKLGWLKPSSVTSEKDSVSIRTAKKNHGIETYSEPDYKTQRENQKKYELSNNLKPLDFVYLDFDQKLFDKSFDVSVSSEYYLTQNFSQSYFSKCCIRKSENL
jgi:hypothetical protein